VLGLDLAVYEMEPENGIVVVSVTQDKNLDTGTIDNWTLMLKIDEPGRYTIRTYFPEFFGIENFYGEKYVYVNGDADEFGGALRGRIVWSDETTIIASPVEAGPQSAVLLIIIIIIGVVSAACVIMKAILRRPMQHKG